jgi:hypothetical protein
MTIAMKPLYGLNQFHTSWLTLVLVRDEQFSGRKTVFNKSWYFSSDIPSLIMTFIMSANSSLTFKMADAMLSKSEKATVKKPTPPNKRRKTDDNSTETAPCNSSFIGAARSFKLKENVDKKVNDDDSLLIFILSSLSNIFATLIEALIMAFWCCCILTSYDLVYGRNQFHISWLTLVLVLSN